MKNILIILAIVVFTLIANLVNATDALSGNSLSKFGTYQLIPSSGSVVINDVAYRTWELTYSGTAEKYQLFVVPGENGNCCFNVKSNNFEIRYSLNSDDFGAKLIDPEFRTIPRKEIMKKVNSEQLKSQEVIVTTPKTEAEYLGLIACFMPLLMN